jgi:transcription initiation factor TFIID subunit 3
VDIIADIYIRHLVLLTSEVQSLAHSCNRSHVEIQDITQALVNVGMLKPVDILDVYEQYDTENRAAQNFLLWVVGHVPENARSVSKVNPEMLEGNKPKSQPVIPEYSQSVQLRPETPEVEEDWLKFLMKKGKKLNFEDAFRNTILNPSVVPKSDIVIAGPTPEEIADKLPYNLTKETPEGLEQESDTVSNEYYGTLY